MSLIVVKWLTFDWKSHHLYVCHFYTVVYVLIHRLF